MTRHADLHVSPFNVQEALVCAMVLMSVADGPMSDAELAMMSRLVQELPAFSDFNSAGIETVTDTVARLLARADGIDQAVTLIHDALPMRLRETAYLLACEVCAADGLGGHGGGWRALQEEARIVPWPASRSNGRA